MKCVLCHKTHTSFAWRYSSYENNSGIHDGWVCEKWFRSTAPEFVPESIKEDRQKYFNSLLQPTRGGEISREYLEAYGNGRLKATEKEIKNAKYTWRDLPGWSNRHKSK
jgi:hypothetical protein